MSMTAYDGLVAILDINETIEKVKNMNMGKEPDLTLCKVTGLLADYRNVLAELMTRTDLFSNGGKNDNTGFEK